LLAIIVKGDSSVSLISTSLLDFFFFSAGLSGIEKSDPKTLLSILVALFPSKVLKKSSWFPKSKSNF
jgi:hypothetical protein